MDRAQTVLVVDDETRIVEILRDYLEANGFAVYMALDGAEELALLARETVDCVLLDIMMPGPSGFDVCRQIHRTSNVPILFLSARDGDSETIRGLGMGDDYIVKTASPGEVIARVKAVLRRADRGAAAAPSEATVLDFGRLVLDLGAHEARVAGERVPLTARELALLRLLVEHPRQVFTRDQLLERIWDGYGDQSTLWGYIRPSPAFQEIAIRGRNATAGRGQVAGIAVLWFTRAPPGPPSPWLAPLGGLFSLLLVLVVVTLFLERSVLGPLAAMGRVAQRIGDSNLEVQLPPSRPREVATVSMALETTSARLREAMQHQSDLEQERRLFIGAVAHDLPNLFTPLYRGETSRNRQSGGAGLGLTIARRILRAHGGDLVAANSATGGALFRGTIPLHGAPAQRDPVTMTRS